MKKTKEELVLLSETYQQSRNEGIQLVHSMFRDFTVIISVIALVLGGKFVVENNELLLIIPVFLGIYGNIIVAKLRTNNLITNYLIYLERLINSGMDKPLVVWSSVIISKNVSAGRKSKWGDLALRILTAIGTAVYLAIAFWIYKLNGSLFDNSVFLKVLYFAFNIILYCCIVFQLFNIYSLSQKYTPEYIKEEAENQYLTDESSS